MKADREGIDMTETSEKAMRRGGVPDPYEPGAERWTLTLTNPGDPFGHLARTSQRDTAHWDVEYLRSDEVISTGSISTPPPHTPPMATLMNTLQTLYKEAEYWRVREEAEGQEGVEVPRA